MQIYAIDTQLFICEYGYLREPQSDDEIMQTKISKTAETIEVENGRILF